ncbi:hypothetical protein MNBD_ALPHA06-1938 [hydrothermal vent metagenome]|uniref:Glycosyltransferase RgtA/B/C/D-like domain-containing protein n=1 Tax=hydrothermal vent metagenome TaxID=652676 RepID=A0A3B0RJE5_9ZZZZ
MPKNRIKSIYNAELFWLAGLLVLLGVRLVVLATSPLSLGGDEAQYWQWSTTPDWGYFSKPPLIAWLIAASNWVLGDSVFAVRAALPVLHGLAAGFLWLTARLLWPEQRRVAWLAASIYLLMPGVFLSSFIMSTDALLLPLGALALLAFFKVLAVDRTWPWMLVLGLALGAGLLAKYAMVFLVFGFLLLVLLDRQVRGKFVSPVGVLAVLVPMAMLVPNFIWNRAHGFATVSHTVANIDLDGTTQIAGLWPRVSMLFELWSGQLGVFGPVTFVLLLGALFVAGTGQRRTSSFRLMILCLVPLLIISVQALASRAHSNWAVLAYIPGVLLLASFAVAGWKQNLLLAGLALHLVAGCVFLAGVSFPERLAATPAGKWLMPLSGWDKTASAILQVAETQSEFAALVTDTRLFHYALAWQIRNQPHPNLRMWPVYGPQPHSQRELMQPLVPQDPARILLVLTRDAFTSRVLDDFAKKQFLQTIRIDLGGGRYREFSLYAASGFFPVARTPAYYANWRNLENPPKP